MRVLWTHNFDPTIPNSGNFMYIFADGLKDAGIDLTLQFLGNLRSPRQLLRAREEIRQSARGYDLVHAQFGSACAMATAVAENVPKVVTLRGSDWHRFHLRPGLRALHSLLATGMTRSVIGQYDLVIPVSHRIAGELEKLPAVVEVIPDPVDVRQFYPVNFQEAREHLGVKNDDRKWVLFTTLSEKNPIKRVALAREAVKRANALCGEIVLKVATGLEHSEMPLFVNACNAVLCTSTHEGWPNSVKEALACDLPFVSTDVSDLRQIAEKESRCKICDPDPDQIAHKICEVLKNSNNIGLHEHVSTMSVEAATRSLVTAYTSLLERYHSDGNRTDERGAGKN